MLRYCITEIRCDARFSSGRFDVNRPVGCGQCSTEFLFSWMNSTLNQRLKSKALSAVPIKREYFIATKWIYWHRRRIEWSCCALRRLSLWQRWSRGGTLSNHSLVEELVHFRNPDGSLLGGISAQSILILLIILNDYQNCPKLASPNKSQNQMVVMPSKIPPSSPNIMPHRLSCQHWTHSVPHETISNIKIGVYK